MVADWYGIEDLPDITGLVVMVWWSVNGVPEKMKAEHLRVRGKWAWTREARGKIQILPPSGSNGHGWGDLPICWQPMDAEHFYWPLGKPRALRNHAVPNFSGSTLTYSAVAEATADEMARERDLMKAEAGTRDGSAEFAAERGIQWWRDVSLIEYRRPGEVSRRMAEARLMRALTLDQIIKLDVEPYKINSAVLVNLKASLLDKLEEAPEDDWVPRLDPQPQDHADYLTAMTWLCKITMNAHRWRAVQGRRMSPPKSWVQIGFEINRTPERARQFYNDVIDRVHASANVIPLDVAPEIEALRERNRAYRSAM